MFYKLVRSHLHFEFRSDWEPSYKQILDDPLCQNWSGRDAAVANGLDRDYNAVITLDYLDQAIYDLNLGLGWDGIHANHFTFSGSVFSNIFAKYLNRLLRHSFVPKIMSQGQIRPIVKNNILGKGDSNNYRPIMNCAMALKIFEYSIMPFLLKSLTLNVPSARWRYRYQVCTGLVHRSVSINKS